MKSKAIGNRQKTHTGLLCSRDIKLAVPDENGIVRRCPGALHPPTQQIGLGQESAASIPQTVSKQLRIPQPSSISQAKSSFFRVATPRKLPSSLS